MNFEPYRQCGIRCFCLLPKERELLLVGISSYMGRLSQQENLFVYSCQYIRKILLEVIHALLAGMFFPCGVKKENSIYKIILFNKFYCMSFCRKF
jgi:hypothetical protein